MSKIYLFRHAQASIGKENYDVLSTKGELQAAELGKYLCKEKLIFDKVYVGDLRRQKHTLEIVSDQYNKNGISIPKPIVLEDLNEHQATEVMKSEFPKMMEDPYIKSLKDKIEKDPKKQHSYMMLGFKYFLHKWVKNEIIVEGIIPWKKFRINSTNALKSIVNETKKGETIGVFSSGGTISSIVSEVLKLKNELVVADLNFSIRNTSFSSLLYSNNEINLLSFNELPHLKDDMITFV
ncbi:MAG: histidine phosphatase family protein [Flavobacteriaceae bacterium]|jgi:broad specificity phosphatase PhoE|nr:histidine phosphatase family protein [Pelagibacterales bacterium]MBT4708754.1 histidine phosphatase family protein [Flavobacteriaceae bacterium]MBT6169315.1 histidine phosphatase family protein [Flavobacteriaceae bacterium]MBT6448007.1 histidine phosphatase family protein [Flavobacteriaceae bacterium]